MIEWNASNLFVKHYLLDILRLQIERRRIGRGKSLAAAHWCGDRFRWIHTGYSNQLARIFDVPAQSRGKSTKQIAVSWNFPFALALQRIPDRLWDPAKVRFSFHWKSIKKKKRKNVLFRRRRITIAFLVPYVAIFFFFTLEISYCLPVSTIDKYWISDQLVVRWSFLRHFAKQ